MNSFAAFLSGGALAGAVAILSLSVLGSVLFVGIVLCSRRFDPDPGADPDGGDGGGGGHGPRPGEPSAPLTALEPPLGEIRASRTRPPRPRRAAVTPGSRST